MSANDDHDYLWDRSGPPDPEVERLERLLRPAGHDRGRAAQARPRRARRVVIASAGLAAAAAAAVLLAWPRRTPPPAPGASWQVSALAGTPRVGATTTSGSARLAAGGWIETDASARARLAVGEIGAVDVEPGSRVRLVDPGTADHRIELARGTVHARIWAPPGSFFVETPAGVAVNLGCAYTLSVDAEGSGRLAVSSGWVAYEHRGRESFVPAGGVCETRPGHGPGTPFYDDAPAPLREALATFDFHADAGARRDALGAVLGAARPRDVLTLWHLLPRVPSAAERGRVFDRLAAFVPPPAPVTRAAIVAGGDVTLLDRWWNELGLGPVDHWRRWKASAPPR